MKNLYKNKIGCVIGIISVFFYFICTFWGGLFTTPVLKELHFNLLQLAYPGFTFTIVGYIIGLVEAFIYGWIIGTLFTWLCKNICVKTETETE